MMDKKILYITGCLGFIGSCFTKKALEKGWKVYGVDKMTYASNKNLLEVFQSYKNFIFFKEDIKNLSFLEDCDYVINFAAESHVENSITDSTSFIDTNIIGTKNILDLIKKKHGNVGQKPLMFHISTDEVYGDIEDGQHSELDQLKPSNPYSASKASADMLVMSWARTYDIEYIILRPTNNYGKYQYPEKLIPLSVKNLLRNKKIRLHNNGTPVRNWLHVEDTSEAIFTILSKYESDRQNIVNQIYNVSGGFEQTNKDTLTKIIKCLLGEENIEAYVDFSYNRKGQDVRYSLNDDKLKRLGWSPKKNFDLEISEIVEFYKNEFQF